MAGQAPNSQNIDRVAAGVANTTSINVHPEYQYWRPEWRKLRDVLAGQREVKRMAQTYLRALKGQDSDDYAIYLDRATFYNMTGQTLNGMVGQVFQRDPIVGDLPKKFKDAIRSNFAKDGSGHVNFAKTVISEQIALGRFGVLVDAPASPSTEPISYAVGYSAENILDWDVGEVNGFYQPTMVLVREFARTAPTAGSQFNPWIGQPKPGSPAGKRALQTAKNKAGAAARTAMVAPVGTYVASYTYTTVYRKFVLEQQDGGNYVYMQYVSDDPNGVPTQTFMPTVRGIPLDFIPFKFFGASANTADCEKPPLLDIADLNISHYRTYAELEYGRLFTALPVYYAPGREDEGASEYHIGPNIVWEVPSGEIPGLLEFTGNGLKALETALATKEAQIAAIGGHMMPGMSGAKGSESPAQTMLRESNEQSLLLNVLQAAECGMNDVFRWWLMWRDVPLKQTAGIDYSVNRDFLSSNIGARELRAIQQMYGDGIIPLEVLYGYLIKAAVVDADMSLEDFQVLLDDKNSFANNPDAQARQRGYASRQQELDQASVAREADMQQQEIDLQTRQVVLEEKAPPPVVKVPAAGGPNPSPSQGPKPPKPGRGGVSATIKKPSGGGQAGGNA